VPELDGMRCEVLQKADDRHNRLKIEVHGRTVSRGQQRRLRAENRGWKSLPTASSTDHVPALCA
jgi:hypothetical protein